MIDPFQALLKQDWVGLNRYLEHGNVNVTDAHGRTLLHYAIKLSYTQAVQILLRAFIDVDLADEHGNTCFHYAVFHNRLSYLRVLFTTTGNPMTRNKNGQTPLYMACRYGKEDCIDLYLEKYKLDMGEKDAMEETILMAFLRGRGIQLIQKYGGYQAWLEEPNYLGNTPLIVAAMKDSLESVSFLLDFPIFVNAKNHLEETALFYAVQNKNKAMIDLLLRKGAFLDFKDKNANTIYLVASKEILEYIEERNAIYHLASYQKKYPLHYAIYINDAKRIEKYLNLKHHAIVDSYGYTPMDLAKRMKNKAVIDRIKALERIAKIVALEQNKRTN